ncbi:GNAT family N-acetyltransferase [Candidatus Roizmanbacteria bacterium]|nr:GNAT family N-acetyltransferase [Candidatus Roizmanbacteria bacterium]
MSIIISTLASEEWTKYRDIRIESLQNEPTAFLSSPEEEEKLDEQIWINNLKKSSNQQGFTLLFAKDGNQVIGMVAGFWGGREKIKHIAHIYGTYVNPAYRGKGVGRLLMQAVIDKFKSIPEVEKVKIEVNAQNISAFTLYQKMGFKIIGKAEKELKINGVYYDEILMEQFV